MWPLHLCHAAWKRDAEALSSLSLSPAHCGGLSSAHMYPRRKHTTAAWEPEAMGGKQRDKRDEIGGKMGEGEGLYRDRMSTDEDGWHCCGEVVVVVVVEEAEIISILFRRLLSFHSSVIRAGGDSTQSGWHTASTRCCRSQHKKSTNQDVYSCGHRPSSESGDNKPGRNKTTPMYRCCSEDIYCVIRMKVKIPQSMLCVD